MLKLIETNGPWGTLKKEREIDKQYCTSRGRLRQKLQVKKE